MSRHSKIAILMLMSVAPAFAMAQTQQPPPNPTEPSSASQKAMYDQMMKECMKREHQKNPSLAEEQAKRSCESQLKRPAPPKN